jgi:hypothetical protein
MSILGGSSGSGNPEAGQGGGNPAAGSGSNAGAPAAGSGAGSGSGGQASWRDSLPADIKDNPALQSFSDVGNLAKSYIHAQQQIGKKGIIPPSEKSSEQEWSDFYKAIGVPDLEKFHVEHPKEANEELITKFKETAQKAGMLPKQAQSLLNWYLEQEKTSVGARTAETKRMQEEQIVGLKKEWGDGFDKQVAFANYVVREIGGKDFAKYVSESGLGNDVNLIKIFAKLGAALGGDKALVGQGGVQFGSTPAEVQSEIDTIMGDTKHPYFDRSHPNHAHAVQQMEGLYRKLYSPKAG